MSNKHCSLKEMGNPSGKHNLLRSTLQNLQKRTVRRGNNQKYVKQKACKIMMPNLYFYTCFLCFQWMYFLFYFFSLRNLYFPETMQPCYPCYLMIRAPFRPLLYLWLHHMFFCALTVYQSLKNTADKCHICMAFLHYASSCVFPCGTSG